MKQFEDTKAGDLLQDGSKRARGRPPLAAKKSDAERARLYRERKKTKATIKRDITENRPASVGMLESRIVLLNAENMLLSDRLQAALDFIAALEAKLISVTRHKKYVKTKPLTA